MSIFSHLRSLLTGARTAESTPFRVDHPVLGVLAGSPDLLKGTLPFGTALVPLQLSPDGQSLDSVLSLAQRVAHALEQLHTKALAKISATYLAAYNDTWRIGEEADAEGRTVRFERPALSPAQFLARFSLAGVSIVGLGCVELWYECGDLFWGHDISVSSLDGDTFEDLDAALQG